jgi:hypothetical protein
MELDSSSAPNGRGKGAARGGRFVGGKQLR